MARDMGANAVRTWGFVPVSYFDRAKENGLLVDAGIWFNPVRGSTTDSYQRPAYCAALKEQALAYVRERKDHPALLAWNLGNEVFAFTESEAEREAFGHFLEDLAEAVKKEDPNHPIIYACSDTRDLPYLKKLVPAVDIIGINTYGGFGNALAKMSAEGETRPVIATEYGPLGAWDTKKDVTGLPFDPYDNIKAAQYGGLWREIANAPGRSLGGFAFVLGDSRNQDSLTWWNVNYADLKRDGYWALYTAYTGKAPANRPPRIRLFKVSRVTGLDPGQSIDLEVTATDPEGDRMEYGYLLTDIASDPLIVQQPRSFPLHPVPKERDDHSHVSIEVPNDPGLYRVYAFVRDGRGNVAVASRGIKVEPLSPGETPVEPR